MRSSVAVSATRRVVRHAGRRNRPAPPECRARPTRRRCPGMARRGWPTDGGPLGVVDREARGAHGRQQGSAPPRVPRPLLLLVGVVIQRGHHRGLDRRRHRHPGVFAHRQRLGDQACGLPRRSQPGSRPATRSSTASAPPATRCGRRRRPTDAAPRRLGVPAQTQVALVGSHPTPRSRAHPTTLRRWSTPSTRPVGLLGEFK